MSISISGSTYTVVGTVTNKATGDGLADLHVVLYDKDLLKDDFLAIAVTDKKGGFEAQFDSSRFESLLDRKPDIYFSIRDGGFELLNTKDDPIKNATESSTPIAFEVSLNGDKLREQINIRPSVWKGGYEQSNPAFSYPDPDLTSLPMRDNMDNIDKLQRQQKVLWPEFSWLSELGDPTSRCYQMFAPDISRLGYTEEGQVFSIICPQQGTAIPHLGAMNVEVTVTGNRGWANEDDRSLAADMTVTGKIWFSPSAHQNKLVQLLSSHFNKNDLPFPTDKAHAIEVSTFDPGHPDRPIFPLRKGVTDAFDLPPFARHDSIAWSVANLGVEIGPIVKTGIEKVDHFNQAVLDIFNIGSGNMLKDGNTLTWNVWFTAPEFVNQTEWRNHAEYWRESIDADHGSPEGPGTVARYFDGTPFKPLKELAVDELKDVFKAFL